MECRRSRLRLLVLSTSTGSKMCIHIHVHGHKHISSFRIGKHRQDVRRSYRPRFAPQLYSTFSAHSPQEHRRLSISGKRTLHIGRQTTSAAPMRAAPLPWHMAHGQFQVQLVGGPNRGLRWSTRSDHASLFACDDKHRLVFLAAFLASPDPCCIHLVSFLSR